MEIRYPLHPEQGKTLDTAGLRRAFLISGLFKPGEISLTYSHFDRIIIGGICPAAAALVLSGAQTLAAEFFLQRREAGVINIGGDGAIKVDGKAFPVAHGDGFYLGMGGREVSFASTRSDQPARFYFLSGTAHHAYPHKSISKAAARQVKTGSIDSCNKRTIYQFLHPEVLDTCQLCMGMTELEANCVWNTMPTHTHERRMEVYLYFNLKPDAVVFHMMGQTRETRHIIVRNEEAVISPSWSIHSGVGTSPYSFIWGMVGENQTFTDMDQVPMDELL